jgi:2-polyprenyl-3-methyl-5-hydroxy-6-metoxy-1,4-benzoquinol methylase
VDDRELRKQVNVLMRVGGNGHRPSSLFETETKLNAARYSKGYYEPDNPALLSAIPSTTRSVLSIGCGWGAAEKALASRGMRVVAVPLDPVIASSIQAEGIEVLAKDLCKSREELKNRRFDCLLLSNILHLVQDPVEILSSFGQLLSDTGITVAVVPNMTRLPLLWKGISEKTDFGSYKDTGVHISSVNTITNWFERAGMRVERIVHILPARAELVGRFTFGLMNPLLSSEFVAVARKN